MSVANGKLGMSMVLTCYNQQEYVKDAIRSVFEQDYDGPMQLVIVDDASDDDSLLVIQETVREYGGGWDVEVVSLPENLGVAGATDAGWAKAKHEWILMVDGDDVQKKNRCSLIFEIANRVPNLGVVSFCVRNIDKNGHPFGYASYGLTSYDSTRDEICLKVCDELFLNEFKLLNKPDIVRGLGASTAFHRSLWDKWGPLCQDETSGMRFEQDPTWMFRAALSMSIVGSKKIAVDYRQHDHNLSNISLSSGVDGIVESEKHQEKYQKFHADSVLCKIRDVRRAKSDQRLTNWPIEMLNLAEAKLEVELAGCQIRYMWWSVSYFERIKRTVTNWRHFRASGTSLARLLPFRLFCWLKLRKRQRDWAQ